MPVLLKSLPFPAAGRAGPRDSELYRGFTLSSVLTSWALHAKQGAQADSAFQEEDGNMGRLFGVAMALGMLSLGPATANPGPADPGSMLAALGGGDPAVSLSSGLRKLVLNFLPDPLYQDDKHWNKQKVVEEVKWRGKGFHVHPEKVAILENDGLWWKVRVTARQPAETLILDLREVQYPEPGRMTFQAFVALDLDVDYERQRWDEGRRVFGAGLRGRMRAKVTLWCEATTRTEQGPKQLFPDTIFRLRVVRADCQYDQLVIEHIAGVGGDAAKLFGETAIASIHRWRPSLERRLLEKADAAIVKAGDTREIRIGLSRLLGGRTFSGK
jgi:hypothetical protein